MLQPFDSQNILILRARDHIKFFDHVEQSTIRQIQPRHLTGTDPQNGDILHKLKIEFETPKILTAISFDIINCLRSALDHAVYDAARIMGADPKPEYTKFPMGRTFDDVKNDIERFKAKDIPLALRPILMATEPFSGGKNQLYELNQLRNQKIHRILEPCFTSVPEIGFQNGDIERAEFDSVHEWSPETKELTFLRARSNSRYSIDIKVDVRACITGQDLFNFKPAVEVFTDIATTVDGIVNVIEHDAIRLSRTSGP
ncbi:MAG: hypothetical protein CFE32_03155 [Alphaproteobacteria bacterium PA3]|nr:MAG: hypothetical protein CFE32_03155 [Alphaproteobacteria bacterium PA3]